MWPPSEERIAEAVQFCKAGQSLRALARDLKLSADTVRKVLVEAGVEIRRR
jgi:lambda repressor-like predicted transcriptional regulator